MTRSMASAAVVVVSLLACLGSLQARPLYRGRSLLAPVAVSFPGGTVNVDSTTGSTSTSVEGITSVTTSAPSPSPAESPSPSAESSSPSPSPTTTDVSVTAPGTTMDVTGSGRRLHNVVVDVPYAFVDVQTPAPADDTTAEPSTSGTQVLVDAPYTTVGVAAAGRRLLAPIAAVSFPGGSVDVSGGSVRVDAPHTTVGVDHTKDEKAGEQADTTSQTAADASADSTADVTVQAPNTDVKVDAEGSSSGSSSSTGSDSSNQQEKGDTTVAVTAPYTQVGVATSGRRLLAPVAVSFPGGTVNVDSTTGSTSTSVEGITSVTTSAPSPSPAESPSPSAESSSPSPSPTTTDVSVTAPGTTMDVTGSGRRLHNVVVDVPYAYVDVQTPAPADDTASDKSTAEPSTSGTQVLVDAPYTTVGVATAGHRLLAPIAAVSFPGGSVDVSGGSVRVDAPHTTVGVDYTKDEKAGEQADTTSQTSAEASADSTADVTVQAPNTDVQVDAGGSSSGSSSSTGSDRSNQQEKGDTTVAVTAPYTQVGVATSGRRLLAPVAVSFPGGTVNVDSTTGSTSTSVEGITSVTTSAPSPSPAESPSPSAESPSPSPSPTTTDVSVTAPGSGRRLHNVVVDVPYAFVDVQTPAPAGDTASDESTAEPSTSGTQVLVDAPYTTVGVAAAGRRLLAPIAAVSFPGGSVDVSGGSVRVDAPHTTVGVDYTKDEKAGEQADTTSQTAADASADSTADVTVQAPNTDVKVDAGGSSSGSSSSTGSDSSTQQEKGDTTVAVTAPYTQVGVASSGR